MPVSLDDQRLRHSTTAPDIFGGTHGGYRLRGGHYTDPCGLSGVDAEFLMLGTRSSTYHGDSSGDPILARPFLNAQTGLNDAQLIAFPDLTSGVIDINATSNLYSGAIHYREVLWQDSDVDNICKIAATVPAGRRWDFSLVHVL